jgi:geranylgeranyl diphosphate synthase type I
MSELTFTALQRHQEHIIQELYQVFLPQNILSSEGINNNTLATLYGQMQYHLGWLDQHLRPTHGQPGKLLRPTLLLLSYELAWAMEQTPGTVLSTLSLQPALPAAAAIELAHNFTLLHDDIEDGDIERRHRPTVWSVWGIPQAILVGDALFALARLHLWKVQDAGIAPATVLHLARLFDSALLQLTEGQHLDMAFEQLQQISLTSYEEMISRKTATLMRCAVEMGATLGTRNQDSIQGLARFGHALGLAFQIRDDILGVWASEAEAGKLPAGDIYRRKKSLPVLHALQRAPAEDQQAIARIYHQHEPITQEQVTMLLTIFARTQTREHCTQLLKQQCQQARLLLAQASAAHEPLNALATRARTDLEALIDFIERG